MRRHPGMVAAARMRLCPPCDYVDVETVLNRASKRFSALAAVLGVR
jgi:hypothetical protein